MVEGRMAPRVDLESIRLYLDEVGRYPLLTPEEERTLGRAVWEGKDAERQLYEGPLPEARRRDLERTRRAGLDAREAMIRANLRLVVSIARRYHRPGLPLEDLIQEGNIGLMRAVDKFDWRLGFRFSTYATWWIRQAVQRAIADRGRTIRVPVHMHEKLALVRREKAALEAGVGREATEEEVATAVGMTPDRLRELRLLTVEPASLDAPVGEDEEANLGDFIADGPSGDLEEAALEEMDRLSLHRILSTLDERERRVVALRFGLDGEDPLTLEEVGRHIGVTRERIRQLTGTILAKLRHPTRSALLLTER
jgi:RNA polymerase primary sigma factor